MSEGSTEVIAEGKLEGLLLCALLGAVDVFEILNNKNTEVGLFDGKPIGTTIGDLDGATLGA